MNLEQIKERQESINGQLSNLLEDFTNLINFIAGDELNKPVLNTDEVDNRDYTNGVVEKIIYDQDQTDRLINLLRSQWYKLNNKTFHQVESSLVCKTNS